MKNWIKKTGLGTVTTHQCNCIGCCENCGQCRTSPWHMATCREMAKLNEMKRKVIESAQNGD